MSRLSNSGVLVPALIAVAITACGGGAKKEEGAGGADANAPAAAAAEPVKVENAATVTGTIAFTGAVPAPAKIDMSEEPVCAQKHTGGATTDEVVVNDGKLENVFVYVKSGLPAGSYPAGGNVTIDQDGCMYKPHILGVQVGQNLVVKNSNGILHNIKVKPTANRPFNISQPTSMETTRSFEAKEVMVPVECNVHGWMHAYIGVLDNPYFAVSEKDGKFKIPNLPPGNYVLTAWHEKYGTQDLNVTVGPNETKDVAFSFAAKTATRVPLAPPLVLAHSN